MFSNWLQRRKLWISSKDCDGRLFFFYLDSCEDSDCAKKGVYNHKPQNTPPNKKLLDPFETDIFKLIRKVKFKREHNNFQMKLNKDIIIIIMSRW